MWLVSPSCLVAAAVVSNCQYEPALELVAPRMRPALVMLKAACDDARCHADPGCELTNRYLGLQLGQFPGVPRRYEHITGEPVGLRLSWIVSGFRPVFDPDFSLAMPDHVCDLVEKREPQVIVESGTGG